MTCPNCDPKFISPGRLIKIKPGTINNPICLNCGDLINKASQWDSYFHNICVAVSSKSPCLSRQIGAILVRDRSIVSTGFNGPARGYPHCQGTCPRKLKGYKSGEGLIECPAAHAEANCIANAARIGATTIGTTLYMNCITPCKDCMILLVNAGIVEVVIEELKFYHEMSKTIASHGNIKIRTFDIKE
jgi:dCMP deaminase